MKKITLVFLFLSIVIISSFAQDDLNKIKGDWKSIQLGDSNEVVLSKLQYLENSNAIGEYGVFDNFANEKRYCILVQGIPMFEKDLASGSLNFTSDKKLYSIILSFNTYPENLLSTTIKEQIYNKIKPMFIKLYGKTKESHKFPTTFDIETNKTYLTDIWELKQKNNVKRVSIGISRIESSDYYCAEISITDLLLNEKNMKDQDDKLNDNIDKSSTDFN